jgi:integrase
MSLHKPAYGVKKGSNYYWQPSASLRRQGFRPEHLGRDEAVACKKAEAINAKVEQWRGGQPIRADQKNGTLPWLIEKYKQSPEYRALRESTKQRRGYEMKMLLKWSEQRGNPPIQTIRKLDAQELWSRLVEKTPGAASQIVGMGRLLWNWADDLDEDLVSRNPFAKVKLPSARRRTQVWQPEQIEILLETMLATPCDPLHNNHEPWRSMALAVLIAMNTAQRRGDIIALNWGQYSGTAITLTQSKTGTTLTVPCTAELKQALDDARSAAGVVMHPDRPVLVSEIMHRRWSPTAFQQHFRMLRRAAGLPDDLQFRDLRRTATVQLAEAGCTVPEIAAFGGWSIASVHQMLKVYCPLNLTMANNGLVKLERYRAAEARWKPVGVDG